MRSHIFLFGSLPKRRPPEFTAILMFEFWREATATSVPGLLFQSGRRRPENVSILSSLLRRQRRLHVSQSVKYCFASRGEQITEGTQRQPLFFNIPGI